MQNGLSKPASMIPQRSGMRRSLGALFTRTKLVAPPWRITCARALEDAERRRGRTLSRQGRPARSERGRAPTRGLPMRPRPTAPSETVSDPRVGDLTADPNRSRMFVWPAAVVGTFMRCLVCAAEMRLAEVVPDATMPVPGYEHHTFRCPQCGDEERRLAFAREGESRVAHPPKSSAPEPPALRPDEPASFAAAAAAPEPRPAEPNSAAAPPSFALASALTRRLSKLAAAIRSLPASASRLAKQSIRKAPPASAPPLPSPSAPPVLQLPAVEPISPAAESRVTNVPGPARRSSDPDGVLAALSLARQLAEPGSSSASASHFDEAQASNVAPLAAASEPTALSVPAGRTPLSTPQRGEAESIPVAPHAKSETAELSALARAPEPAPAPPLSDTSEAEAGFDDEDLLRHALEILDGPKPTPQPASAALPKPAAAARPMAPAKRADPARTTHAEQAKKSLASRAVRIERAPDDRAK